MANRALRLFTSPRHALTYALKLLTRRGYSQAEIVAKLARRGVSQNDISTIVAKLASLNLLDDTSYAHAVSQSKSVYGRKSRRWIAGHLRSKGIDNRVISQTVNQLDDAQESANIASHIESYVARHGQCDTLAKRHKLIAALARKGFAVTMIIKTLQSHRRLTDQQR